MKVHKTNKHSLWGLWFISESENELANLVEDKIDDTIINPNKRREWLAGRALLKELVFQSGNEYPGVYKDEFGKPHLQGLPHHISLSHSFPYVAAQLNESHAVGIDLEQPKSKLLNIAPRIMSADELIDAGEDLVKHCVYWCAKEAMYKIYGKRGLHFSSELLLDSFRLQNAGQLNGTIIANGNRQPIELNYVIQSDYVLVYTQT